MDDATFRRDFFRQLDEPALEPDSPLYIPIYDGASVAADDPIGIMQRTIEWGTGASVQLFSGFRGSGKSTELRRLRARLRAAGYLVLLFDAEEYLNMSLPVDVPDFLLAVMEALGETAVREGYLAHDPERTSYWQRFGAFLRSVHLDELSAEVGVGPAKLGMKANLRNDPEFSRKLQERIAGHLGTFVDDVRDYVNNIRQLLYQQNPDMAGIVVVVDSIEHIRGISVNAEDVQRSVESLFATHASKLHLPGMHVIYTVPPWLKVLYPGLGSLYEGVQVLPTLKVHGKDGAPYEPGLRILTQVTRARGDWGQLLGRSQLDQICLASGGHLRDLMRILRDVLLRVSSLPATDSMVERALAAARNELLPIAEDDARWLARIAGDHDVALPDMAGLPALARFLDTHLVLCYRNGEEWYDVHPLIRDAVLAQARK